jgi:putative restriction endonuclease
VCGIGEGPYLLNFDGLIIGQEYDRPFLAKKWGYQTFNAISRGVFTPKGQNIIIFFITKEKQEALTPYVDHIDNDLLYWEGEKGHGNDNRIISKRDEIHVFYRDRHHEDFIYKGRVLLINYRLYSDRPSKFRFQLIDIVQPDIDIVAELSPDYFPAITERTAIVASRIGQGYFREESIKLWHTCCVSGFTKECVLMASHIKPWRASDNRERLDGYNSLLLVPTYDRLFDKGYIGFDLNGRITISNKIDMSDVRKTGLSEDSCLLKVPDRTMHYLEYHQTYIFDLVEQGN